MIYGRVATANKYNLEDEKFQIAFQFLDRDDLAELPDGWIEMEAGVRVSVQHYTTMPGETLNFETHERYFDVQYLVDGEERIRVIGREGLVEKTPYNEEDDITFYNDPPISGAVLLRAGEYVILAPEDAHKPRCMAANAQPVKKIVVKVPV